MLSIDYLKDCEKRNMSCSEVARELGANISSVYTFCKRNKIKLRKAKTGGQNVKNIIEQKFGSLIVLERAGSIGKLALWKCRCLCSNEVVCKGSDLRQGKTKTCGCKKGIENRRNWQGYGNIPRSHWSSLYWNATQRKIEFNLEIQKADSLYLKQNKKCNLSDLPISFEDKTASLDRIDNRNGYTIDNVQWVHKDINKMKQTFSQDRFIELCEFVGKRSKNHVD